MISPLVVVAWPIGFLIGSMVVIWGTKAATRETRVQPPSDG